MTWQQSKSAPVNAWANTRVYVVLTATNRTWLKIYWATSNLHAGECYVGSVYPECQCQCLYSDRGPIDINSFKIDSIHSLNAVQEHWYRNPRVRFSSLSSERFRYDPRKDHQSWYTVTSLMLYFLSLCFGSLKTYQVIEPSCIAVAVRWCWLSLYVSPSTTKIGRGCYKRLYAWSGKAWVTRTSFLPFEVILRSPEPNVLIKPNLKLSLSLSWLKALDQIHVHLTSLSSQQTKLLYWIGHNIRICKSTARM